MSTFTELPNSAPDGEHWLVLVDETQGGVAVIYKAYGGKWEFISEFELSLDIDWDNLLTHYDIGVLGEVAGFNHLHDAADINAGILPINRGGTNSSTAANARTALGITPGNIGAEPGRELMTAAQAQAGTDTVIRSVTAQRIR